MLAGSLHSSNPPFPRAGRETASRVPGRPQRARPEAPTATRSSSLLPFNTEAPETQVCRRVHVRHGFQALRASLRAFLQTAFLNEARTDRRDVRLSVAQRGGCCVDRVGAEDEIVLVRDGRAENEFGVSPRLELHSVARRLERRQVALSQFAGNRYGAG